MELARRLHVRCPLMCPRRALVCPFVRVAAFCRMSIYVLLPGRAYGVSSCSLVCPMGLNVWNLSFERTNGSERVSDCEYMDLLTYESMGRAGIHPDHSQFPIWPAAWDANFSARAGTALFAVLVRLMCQTHVMFTGGKLEPQKGPGPKCRNVATGL